MWNDPRLLHATAGALGVLALALFGLVGVQLLLRSPWFPVEEVTVLGALRHTTREQVRTALDARMGGNFFALDLAALRDGLERLPWVRRVTLRRIWPSRVVVEIEEHVALARWGEDALVNTHGERFAATSEAPLPVFAGPVGAEAALAQRYRRYGELLAPLGVRIERVVLSPRHAWQLVLSDGLTLMLGRDGGTPSAEARLTRFVAAYPVTLGRIRRTHEYVDLRYANGFALRLPGVEPEPQKKPAGKG